MSRNVPLGHCCRCCFLWRAGRKPGLQLRCVPTHAVVHRRKPLRRILQNFVSNAIRYSRRGASWWVAARTAFGIEVHDQGPGGKALQREIDQDNPRSTPDEGRRLG